MDKFAIVTGGTKGIGKQIVLDLLGRGYFVYTNYGKDSASAKSALLDFKAVSTNVRVDRADQSDTADFSKYIAGIAAECPTIDCIVCNAGMTLRKDITDISNSEWARVMDVNVNSHFSLIRECFPKIPGGSRIIFIGSLLGIQPHSASLAYGVTKSAQHSLALNLVKSFEGTDTTVNVIAPGFVDTEWQKDKPQFIKDNIIAKTAVKRFASVEEISGAVMFCIDNRFVNGSVIEVNGGYCFK